MSDDFEDDEDTPRRKSRNVPRRRGFECPYCGSDRPPRVVRKISSQGWTLFFVMMIFIITLPFCWIPLLTSREEIRTCSDCGTKLG